MGFILGAGGCDEGITCVETAAGVESSGRGHLVSSRKRRSCGLHVVAGRNLTGQPPPVEPLVGTVLEMV